MGFAPLNLFRIAMTPVKKSETHVDDISLIEYQEKVANDMF